MEPGSWICKQELKTLQLCKLDRKEQVRKNLVANDTQHCTLLTEGSELNRDRTQNSDVLQPASCDSMGFRKLWHFSQTLTICILPFVVKWDMWGTLKVEMSVVT